MKHPQLGFGVVEEPIQGEALPGQCGEERVVEGEGTGGNQRRREKDEEGEHIGPVAEYEAPILVATEHARRLPQLRAMVPARVWRESLRPSQTTAEVKASSRKPKAAPDSQL